MITATYTATHTAAHTALRYTELARDLAMQVRYALIDHQVWNSSRFDTPQPQNSHRISSLSDCESCAQVRDLAIEVILNLVADLACHVYIACGPVRRHPAAEFSLLIQPIDHAFNWECGLGDPCLAIAIADTVEDVRLGDLTYAYVLGLRSGDAYETRDGYAYYQSGLTRLERPIKTSVRQELDQAIGSIKLNRDYTSQYLETHERKLHGCHHRASAEYSTIELCELARGARDFLVDRRSRSDRFDFISYPILKQAGGVLCDLDGTSLDAVTIVEAQTLNYIACANMALRDQVLQSLASERIESP